MRNCSLFLFIFCATIPCFAATYTVDDDGPADFNNIQAAIDFADNNDTIIVYQGTYGFTRINKSVTVQSTDPNDPNIVNNTIISGNNQHSCISVPANNRKILINGFFITEGYSPYSSIGGGISGFLQENAIVKIENCVFSKNLVRCSLDGGGGAIQFDNLSFGPKGCLEIKNCIFIGNMTKQLSYSHYGGGGAICYYSANYIDPNMIDEIIIENCDFIGNDSNNRGGAIYCTSNNSDPGPNLTITDCSFTGNAIAGPNDNSMPTEGGAIYYSGRNNLKINNCTFTKNSVTRLHTSSYPYGSGGAVFCRDSNAVITHCKFNLNSASSLYSNSNGGAVCIQNSNLAFKNCTFSANSCLVGGAIYCAQSDVIIANSIFCGNRAIDNVEFWDRGGALAVQSSNTLVDNCTFNKNSSLHSYGAIDILKGQTLIKNSIFWDNNNFEIDSGLLSNQDIMYCNIKGKNWPYVGNIDVDPCFVSPGYWDANGTPADANDDFWVDGDYHLKSEGWRWDNDANNWTWDEVTSRCIDAGNPGSPLADEPLTLPVDPLNRWGQNLRIDMGAYGGTSEASMPPYDWAILSDIDNDGIVDFTDFAWLSGLWLGQDDEQFADFDRDGDINNPDLSLFTSDWLNTTIWH